MNRDQKFWEHFYLVKLIAKKKAKNALDLEDYIQEGALGLMEAIDNYDPTRGSSLKTYAYNKISYKINDYITRNCNLISPSKHFGEEWAKVKRAEKELRLKLRREPTFDELQNELKWTEERLTRHLTRPAADLVDFDNEKEMNECYRGEYKNPHENWITEYNETLINQMLNSLTPTEREIIELRYGFQGQTYTLYEIGQKLGYSSEGVRKIEKRALEKLRNHEDVYKIILENWK